MGTTNTVSRELLNIFKNLGNNSSASPYQIFTDFITISAVTISNGWDKAQFVDREALYMRTIQTYSKNELNLFASGLGLLFKAMPEAPHDYLGELFMGLGLGNESRGQFFSPMHVCRMMAKSIIDDQTAQLVKTNGFITVNDPCVGGGAMVIAFADEFQKAGFNYPTQLYAVVQDVDIYAVYMSYIQLSLMGLGCRVIHGDSLKLEQLSNWYSPWNICYGWEARYLKSQTHPQKMQQISAIDELDNGYSFDFKPTIQTKRKLEQLDLF